MRALGVAGPAGRRVALLRQLRQRELAIALVVIVAVFVGVFVTLGRGGAASTDAVPVPPSMVDAFVEAASSCRALTPPRLAAQVMAASGFATTGEQGVAALTAEEWEVWAPSAGVPRQAVRENILALAHMTCDFVGRIRVAGVAGERWLLAVAASESSVATVKEAGGVPSAVAAFTDRVEEYAEWYALERAFGGPGVPTSTAGVIQLPASVSPTPSAASTSPSAPAPAPLSSRTAAAQATAVSTPKASQPAPNPTPSQIPAPRWSGSVRYPGPLTCALTSPRGSPTTAIHYNCGNATIRCHSSGQSELTAKSVP